jgi:hypothetical protein
MKSGRARFRSLQMPAFASLVDDRHDDLFTANSDNLAILQFTEQKTCR